MRDRLDPRPGGPPHRSRGPGDSRDGRSWWSLGGLDWHPTRGGGLCPADPGPVWWGTLFFVVPAPENLCAPLSRSKKPILERCGSYDPRFSRKHNHAALSRHGFGQSGFQLIHLTTAVHELAKRKRDGCSWAWSGRWLAHEPIVTRLPRRFHLTSTQNEPDIREQS